jgi:FkbM family methyltransferase
MKSIWEHYAGIVGISLVPTVLEIGAGRGEDTVRLLEPLLALPEHYRYRYYAFEPEPKNFPYLRALAVKRPFVAIDAAVGDRNALVPFHPSGDWPYSGSVKEPRKVVVDFGLTFSPPIQVRMVRLDDMIHVNCHNIRNIDFIWCDVQGAEDLVIAGGQEALIRTRYFYTEYYNTEEYAGQIPLSEIHGRLPGNWKLLEDYGSDALFQNLDWRQR